MKVKALKSFGGLDVGHYSAGQVFDLPDGVDWLEAGLVEAYKEPAEAATAEAPEKAVKPRTTRRRKTTAKREPEK